VGGDLEGGGSRGEDRGLLPKGRRGRGRGRLQQIGERESERGQARVGEERGGSHPLDRNQWPKLALPFELLTPAEKTPKDILFPEECLLKLQTPMPQNKKEKRKISLTSFQKIGVSQVGQPRRSRRSQEKFNGVRLKFNGLFGEAPDCPVSQQSTSQRSAA
jgi:hypothetical protein